MEEALHASGILVSLILVFAIGCGSVARAADVVPVTIGPPMVVQKTVGTAFNWTGCYVGAQGGGGIASDNFTSTEGIGVVAGGQIGCNLQLSQIVIGVEGEGVWSNLASNFNASPSFATNNLFDSYGSASLVSTTTNNRWDADVAARIGLVFDRALIFSKVGAAFGQFNMQSTYSNVTSLKTNAYSPPGLETTITGGATLAGFLVGAGIEYGITPNVTAKLEYDYISFPARNVTFSSSTPLFFISPFSQSFSANLQMVKIGVNLKTN